MPAQVIDLTGLAAADGYVVVGDAAGDLAGASVSNAGDVNGDGIDDYIVGARSNDLGAANSGAAYVIYGRTGPRGTLDLTNLAASEGFRIFGDIANDLLGISVSGAGDVNNDGIDDIIVGTHRGDDGGTDAGETYVIYGQSGSTRGTLDLTNLTNADGFAIQGDTIDDYSGYSVSAAGDINGDGIDDIIIGAWGVDTGGSYAGAAYVIYGQTTTRGRIDLTNLTSTEGFIIQGDAAGDYAGFSVSGTGDVNGDGIDDMIIGAKNGDNGGNNAGEAYVIYGRTGTRGTLDLTNLTSTDGFIIQGDDPNETAGHAVSGAGDINGDGIGDLLVGAILGTDGGVQAGQVYVIYGRAGTARTSLDMTTLAASDGFVIQANGDYDNVGASVSAAGDINGDGIGDLIVGGPRGYDGGIYAGEAYVIFGKSGATRGRIDLANLAATDGLIIQGDAERDFAGGSVSAAGDVNNDGIDDLIVGAGGGDDGGANAGEAYIIYGNRNFGAPPPVNGTAASETVTGTADADTINGLGGNDVLLGGGGEDRFNGGAGNDIVVVDSAGDTVTEASGEGTDAVESNLGSYTLPANVENLEYTGGAAFNGTGNELNNIIVGGAGGDTLSGLDGDDVLGGEAGNDTLNGGNGSDRLNGGTGTDTMNGGDGNDRITVDNAGDVANGGAGVDTLEISAPGLTYTIAADIEIVSNVSGGALTVTLNALANTYGGSSTGIDVVDAGDGQDTVYGRGGNDVLRGQGGNDYLFGEAGTDTLVGGDGIDMIYGGADNDTINGGAGNDTFYGEAGNDLITGGAGLDVMTGGTGNDRFIFTSASDTGNSNATADRIMDFSQAQFDRFDVSQIDAIVGGDPDQFSFLGSNAFTNVAGQLRYQQTGGNTYIQGDTNGDGVADFIIRVDGLHTLTASDFFF